MKKYIAFFLTFACILGLIGCAKNVPAKSSIFQATILETSNQTLLVAPVEGSQELKSSDQIRLPMKNMSPSPEPKVGDVIEITYNGEISESYPAQINEVYNIEVVEVAETITFHDKTFNKSDLSQETIEWLEKYNALSETEQLAISSIPSDLYELCGYGKAEDAPAVTE